MKANRVEVLDYSTFTCVLANLEFPISIAFEISYQTISRQLKYLVRCLMLEGIVFNIEIEY